MSRESFPREWFVDTRVVTFDPTVARRMGRWWQRTIHAPYGITPVGFAAMLIEDLPGTSTARFLSFDYRGGGKASLEFQGTLANTLAYFGGHTLTITPSNRMLEPDLIGVQPEHQARGIGTAIMRNLYKAGLTVGVTRLGIRAGLDVGPYVWIKFGFFPTDREWDRIKPILLQKANDLGLMIPVEERRAIEVALASGSGRAIVAIAALDAMVMSRSQDGHSREVPLGFALLADSGISWYGELSFDDRAAMDIFEERVGFAREEHVQ